jgi:hypothetical protein
MDDQQLLKSTKLRPKSFSRSDMQFLVDTPALAPSRLDPSEMTQSDIDDIAQAFVVSGKRAKSIGRHSASRRSLLPPLGVPALNHRPDKQDRVQDQANGRTSSSQSTAKTIRHECAQHASLRDLWRRESEAPALPSTPTRLARE